MYQRRTAPNGGSRSGEMARALMMSQATKPSREAEGARMRADLIRMLAAASPALGTAAGGLGGALIGGTIGGLAATPTGPGIGAGIMAGAGAGAGIGGSVGGGLGMAAQPVLSGWADQQTRQYDEDEEERERQRQMAMALLASRRYV